MAQQSVADQNEQITKDYFELIKDLRAGKEEAVDKLVDLWDADGTFEFAGAPPVTGAFHGRTAIHVMYKNRLRACGMPLRLEGDPNVTDPKTSAAYRQQTALGIVETDVKRTRALDGGSRIVAGWVTRIGAQDDRGFEVSGSHAFTFKEGKIASLRIVISPKPDVSPNLTLDGLAIEDIGRLALAAWPVV
jgi:ketosteroid isomerase-like protein